MEGASGDKFEALLLTNVEEKKGAPTVVVPHGGPHSVFPASYLMSNVFFNLLGYNVLQVNYRWVPGLDCCQPFSSQRAALFDLASMGADTGANVSSRLA